MYLTTTTLEGMPLGSEVDRLNGGLTSLSVEGVPGDESEAAEPSEALTRNGRAFGIFFLRSNSGLTGLDPSDVTT